VVDNPTPYHITVTQVRAKGATDSPLSTAPFMVPPFGSHMMDVAGGQVSEVEFDTIDDFGAVRQSQARVQ
jgi:P pilus assembly chaperone PapD